MANLPSAFCSQAHGSLFFRKYPAGVAQHQFTWVKPFLASAHLTCEEGEGEREGAKKGLQVETRRWASGLYKAP